MGIYKKNDIRGRVPDELYPERMIRLGSLIADLLPSDAKTIALGGDPRFETDMLKTSLVAGLTSRGKNVADMGITTTPSTYFAAAHNDDIDASIMITASHNPLGTSGLKVSNHKGEAFHYDNFFSRIEELERASENSLNLKATQGRIDFEKGSRIKSQYIEFLANAIQNATSILERPFAIEYGNGSATIFERVLTKMGANHVALHSIPYGRFPRLLPDPATDSCYVDLARVVPALELDYGLAFDADGDRFGAVNEKGERISPDDMTMILASQVLKEYPGATIIIDVKTSLATKQYLEDLGARVKYTKVGHSWVHETLLKKEAAFAAELSGHYYYSKKYYGFDDALYSATQFITFVEHLDKPLSEFIQELPHFHSTPEIRRHKDKKRINTITNRAIRIAERLGGEIIDIDGIRAEFDDGWFLVRSSGTESALSYRVEGKSPKKKEELLKRVEEIISQ